MRNQLTNIIVGIGCFVVVLVLGVVIYLKINPAPAFDYEIFQQELTQFKEENDDFNEVQQEVIAYIQYVENHENPASINESIYDILPEVNVSTAFVSSNDDQLRDMADLVIDQAQEFYGVENIKILDVVYSTEERLAIYTQSPRSYLFYAMSEDKENMVGIIVTPTENGYELETLWSLEQASDVKFVEQESNRLLFLFSNKVF